jgi:hypothetical protein
MFEFHIGFVGGGLQFILSWLADEDAKCLFQKNFYFLNFVLVML